MSSDESSAPVGVPLGEIIGGYRLVRLIGAGSTSHVYLGEHARLGRPAAIKVLHDGLVDNPKVVQRMFTEAKVVNDIRHPNIVDVIDFVDQSDAPDADTPRRVALVMEHIAGPSVDDLRGGQPLPWRQAVGIAQQLIDAVGAAHRAGVIHRDLKPDNLLLDTDPRAQAETVPALKVVDFGIAKVAGPTFGHQTATQTMLGTPAYMAPEQIAQSPPPSSATDVFAVGEILYELLAGQRAYRSARLSDVVRQKLRGEIPDLPLPPLPAGPEIEALLRRCLAFRPEARPRLEEIAELLSAISAADANDSPTPREGTFGGGSESVDWDAAVPVPADLSEATLLGDVVVGLAGQQTQAGWRPPAESEYSREDTLGSSSPTDLTLRPVQRREGSLEETEQLRSSELIEPEPDVLAAPTVGVGFEAENRGVLHAETAMSADARVEQRASARSGEDTPTRDVLPSLSNETVSEGVPAPPHPELIATKVGAPKTSNDGPDGASARAPLVSARDGGPPVAVDDPLAQPWASTVIRPKNVERSRPAATSTPSRGNPRAGKTVDLKRTAENSRRPDRARRPVEPTRTEKPRWSWAVVLPPIALLMAGVVLVVSRSTAPPVERTPTESPPFRGPSVLVRSQPPGAFVEDARTGEFLGKTPVSIALKSRGARRVRVFKAGYTARVVDLSADAPSTWVPLIPE